MLDAATAIGCGVLANLLTFLIVRLLRSRSESLGGVTAMKTVSRYWPLFLTTFVVGAGLGYVWSTTEPPCEALTTSEALATAAWRALEARDYVRVLECTALLTARYAEEAVAQQKELAAAGDFPRDDHVARYGALNDVSTAWFIRGEAYRQMTEREKARAAYHQILEHYSFGQYWDPKGWYWQVAQGAREKLALIEEP